jgi:magnesium transporter
VLVGWQVFEDGEEVRGGTGLDEAIAARELGDFVWIRLASPTAEELEQLGAAFDLPPLAVEDATFAHQRPKLERYGETVFAVLKPAAYDDAREAITLGELHLFLRPGAAITIRHGDAARLDAVSDRLRATPELTALGAAAVLYVVADEIVDGYDPVVRGLERDVAEIEREVFDEDEQPPTKRIYALTREVLDFERATASLLPPLEDLADGRVPDIAPGLAHHFRDVADHIRHVHERTAGAHVLLGEALSANVALISLQENRDQRKISAWAAIALVPTIIGGIWGMNVPALPFSDTVLGFPVILLLMGSTSGYLYWRLRRNGWL